MVAFLLVAIMASTGRLFDLGGPITMGVRTSVAALLSFALVTFVVCHAGHPFLAILRSRPLVYLGTISYGIYLYHQLFVLSSHELAAFLNITLGPALWIIECVLTLGVATLSWHFVERPILRLKDRIPYSSENVTRVPYVATRPNRYPAQSLSTSAAS
jgi:peptidoglycan/LPS O-acetylase OafA/YrhL